METKTVESNLKVSSLINSNDHDRVFALTQEPAGIQELQKNYQLKKIGDLPINASLKQATSLSDPIINNDGSAIIARASYPDSRPVTLWVNTTNGTFVNVEDLFNASPTQLTINPKNSRELYGLIAGQVVRTVPRPAPLPPRREQNPRRADAGVIADDRREPVMRESHHLLDCALASEV